MIESVIAVRRKQVLGRSQWLREVIVCSQYESDARKRMETSRSLATGEFCQFGQSVLSTRHSQDSNDKEE